MENNEEYQEKRNDKTYKQSAKKAQSVQLRLF
jgi:hypothetical protein